MEVTLDLTMTCMWRDPQIIVLLRPKNQKMRGFCVIRVLRTWKLVYYKYVPMFVQISNRFEIFWFFVVHRALFCSPDRFESLRNFQGTAGFPIRNVIRPQNDSKMIFSNRLKFSEAIGRCIRYSKIEYKLRSPPITPVAREYRFSCLLSTIIWGSLHV